MEITIIVVHCELAICFIGEIVLKVTMYCRLGRCHTLVPSCYKCENLHCHSYNQLQHKIMWLWLYHLPLPVLEKRTHLTSTPHYRLKVFLKLIYSLYWNNDLKIWEILVETASCSVYQLQVHLIDFDDENNIINKNMFMHREGEIWHISSSPLDKNVVATIYNKSKLISLCRYLTRLYCLFHMGQKWTNNLHSCTCADIDNLMLLCFPGPQPLRAELRFKQHCGASQLTLIPP